MPGRPDAFDFDTWAGEVRDPAARSREGWGTPRAGKARAAYEIAPLPGGRFAVRVSVAFGCGDSSALSSPWLAFDTRQVCLDHFRGAARRDFAGPRVSKGQDEAAGRMRALLAGPFREPRPEPVVDENARTLRSGTPK